MVVLRQLGLHLRRIYWEQASYKMALALGVVTSAVGLAQFIVLAQYIQAGHQFSELEAYGGNIIAYFLSGSVFAGFVAICLSGFSSYLQSEQQAGTLESVALSPIPLSRAMVFSGVAGLIGTVLGSVVMLGVFGLLFRISFHINLAGVLLVLLFLVLALGSCGLAGCGVLLITKRGDPVTWVVTTLTTLLSGVLYPPSALPQWLQRVAELLPMTYALDGLRRSLLAGAGMRDVAGSLVSLAIWAAIGLPVGLLVLRYGLARSRREGTLSEF